MNNTIKQSLLASPTALVSTAIGFEKDMNCQIQSFDIKDYDLVLKLWEKCEGVGLGDSDKKENIDLFLNRNPGMSFVAFKKNNVIGAVLSGHDGRRGYIHHLAVDPAERKQKIGTGLVEKCLGSMKNQGILKCHIFMFIANETGKSFWQSIGWQHREDISLISKFIQ